MDKMFTENGKIRYKDFYLSLNNSTSSEWDELPVDLINSIIPAIDKNGNPGLLISYHDDEYCCDCTLSCDSIDSVRVEDHII